MPREVTAKVRMQDSPFPSATFLRVIGFHTGIETDQEEIEIEAETSSIRDGNLFVETGKIEVTVRTALILMESPDITGINKGRHLEFPK